MGRSAGVALRLIAVAVAVLAPALAGAQPAPVTNAGAATAPVGSAGPASAPVTAVASCAETTIAPALAHLLRAGRFADVHHAATDARVICGAAAPLDTTRLLDAIALLRLDDRAWAIENLQELATRNEAARVVLAWAYITDGDDQAAGALLRRLPAPRAAAVRVLGALDDEDTFAAAVGALDAPLRAPARTLARGYRDARIKRPALAGALSALVPGSGQVYAGSWQAAAVTFVLNGLFVAATVELASRDMYLSAAATGTAASFFYVGGIMNAVDLARRRNQLAREPYRRDLEELLVPELGGTFAAP